METLESQVAVLTERLDNHMKLNTEYRIIREEADKTYRKSLCDKLDIIVKEIGEINHRCFDRTEAHILMVKHMKNGETIKGIWQDRNFKILLGLVSPIYATIAVMVIKWIIG